MAEVAERPAAGKPLPRGPGAKECFSPTSQQRVTPELVRRLHRLTQPGPGERRLRDPQGSSSAENLRHGASTKASQEAGVLLNPGRQTMFTERLQQLQEQVYSSHCSAPLGRSHDQSHSLPPGMDTMKTTFGTITIKDISAGELVSPTKSSAEVQREAKIGRELYIKSHDSYDVGEMVDRDYDWSVFTRKSQYGVATPHDNTGSGVRNAMHWMTDALRTKETPIVPKQLDDFREKNQPQIGTVHDPIADSLKVQDGHTYGIMVQPDEYSAGELVQMTGPSAFLECRSYDRGILTTIRQHLKKHSYTGFPGLLDAAVKQAKWNRDQVRQLMFQFGVPLEAEMTELLLGWCDDGSDNINLVNLTALINWQEEMTKELDTMMSGRVGENRSPAAVVLEDSYKTSSQTVSATAGVVPTNNYRRYGVPTIRSDRPAPRIRRVADHTNYGDESDAFGLMYPSMYSNHGVYEQDFFAPLNKTEVREIFSNIGVQMCNEIFEELWSEAARKDPNGQVCVESFRAVLEQRVLHMEH